MFRLAIRRDARRVVGTSQDTDVTLRCRTRAGFLALHRVVGHINTDGIIHIIICSKYGLVSWKMGVKKFTIIKHLTKRARGSLSPPSRLSLHGKAVARARRAFMQIKHGQ